MGSYTQSSSVPMPPDYGTRPDGSRKNTGWLGELKAGDSIVTEYSVGLNVDGEEVEMPSVTPYSTDEDVQAILDSAAKNQPPPASALRNAVRWYRDRRKQGRSPFFNGSQEDIRVRDDYRSRRGDAK